jgi:hypothetical protein
MASRDPVPLSHPASLPKPLDPAAGLCETSHEETTATETWQSAQSKAPFQEIAVTVSVHRVGPLRAFSLHSTMTLFFLVLSL